MYSLPEGLNQNNSWVSWLCSLNAVAPAPPSHGAMPPKAPTLDPAMSRPPIEQMQAIVLAGSQSGQIRQLLKNSTTTAGQVPCSSSVSDDFFFFFFLRDFTFKKTLFEKLQFGYNVEMKFEMMKFEMKFGYNVSI